MKKLTADEINEMVDKMLAQELAYLREIGAPDEMMERLICSFEATRQEMLSAN